MEQIDTLEPSAFAGVWDGINRRIHSVPIMFDRRTVALELSARVQAARARIAEGMDK